LPDYFGGDPIPEDAMTNPDRKFDREAWRANHTKEIVRPYLDKVITALKADGIKEFAATGYCFGARYAVDLALDGEVKVISMSHPSSLQVPADFEVCRCVYLTSTWSHFATMQALKTQAKVPILINSCEVDNAFPADAQKAVDALLGDGQYTPGYERTYWPGCTHGFAVRGDMVSSVSQYPMSALAN
jgi:dienelactone hydrolase